MASSASASASCSSIPRSRRALIVGSGVFGIASALALQKRFLASKSANCSSKLDHIYDEIILIDQSPASTPHHAASNDVNRIVRSEYGSDRLYTDLSIGALAQWRFLNSQLPQPLYHECGLLFMTSTPMQQNAFEAESKSLLASEYKADFVDYPNAEALQKDFAAYLPAGAASPYIEGYLNPHEGFTDAGQSLHYFHSLAKRFGVKMIHGFRVDSLIFSPENNQRKVIGVRGRQINPNSTLQHPQYDATVCDMYADFVCLCTGTWTPELLQSSLPELKPTIQRIIFSSAQPVIYLKPNNEAAAKKYTHGVQPTVCSPSRSRPFPVIAADLSRLGWYIFPLSTREAYGSKVLKVAHHGTGIPNSHPDRCRQFTDSDGPIEPSNPTVIPQSQRILNEFRLFLSQRFPDINTNFSIVADKLCYYCDSFDGDFVLDYVPGVENLFVAAGDSGHAMKFLPIMDQVMDALISKQSKYELAEVEGERGNRRAKFTAAQRQSWIDRFRWREPKPTGTVHLDHCRAPSHLGDGQAHVDAALQSKL